MNCQKNVARGSVRLCVKETWLKSMACTEPLIINKWARTHSLVQTGDGPMGAQGGGFAGSGRVWTWRLRPRPFSPQKHKKRKAVGWERCVRNNLRVCFLLIWVCIVLRFSGRSRSSSIVPLIDVGMKRKHIAKYRYEWKKRRWCFFPNSSRNISEDYARSHCGSPWTFTWTWCLYLNKKVLLLRTRPWHRSDSRLANVQTRTQCTVSLTITSPDPISSSETLGVQGKETHRPTTLWCP